nr:immunoglobulin heavy chain junction region [Macaca mulatta]MOY27713.1 immunoglobulin heavy chain junction region [Macaca mulatta]
CARGAYFDCW